MDNKGSYKRAHDVDSTEEPPEIKRSKTDVSLLDLSDCVLTLIFEYVNSFDLYALSLTCTRFNFLIPVKKLWSHVDVRNNPMCGRKFKFFNSNLNDSTRTLMVSGINPNEKCVTNYQFQRLGKITSNLTVLAMEYQLINSSEIQLRHFPTGLRELSLRGTHVERCNNFFQDASVRLKHLHTLVLDECSWVREHSLMALSKFHNLENLSVYKCKNLGDSVAYMSITTRFGFKKILRIDARLTKMGDQFLKCLNNLRTIREIYLEAPEPLGARPNPSSAFLRHMLLGAFAPEPSASPVHKKLTNRASTYCLDEFRPCHKVKCSFRPIGVSEQQQQQQQQLNETEERTESGNVIVVSPFDVGQNDHFINDVRVHVLYGNEAPFEFERQSSRQHDGLAESQARDQQPDDDFESDYNDEDQNEILYNDVNYVNHNLLPIFYESTVSDDGIRWFPASDTNASDNRGQKSLLFRRPFSGKCECAKQRKESNEDWDKPGPSGLNKQDPDEEEFRPPLHAQPIISIRRFGDDPRRQNPIDIVLPIERRDLRVVIERVEPGVQIIVNNNNNNNNNNGHHANNLTRLKVFVARNFNRVTDRVMQNLSGIRLELLDVTRTSISAEAVKRFLLVNPDCRVVHESTCRCKPDR